MKNVESTKEEGFKFRTDSARIKSEKSLVAIAKSKIIDTEKKIPSLKNIIQPERNVQYLKLRLTSLDIKKTGLLLYILATYNAYRLTLKSFYIKRLGDKTSHIHPLRFLETIVKNDRLRAYCDSIVKTPVLGKMVKMSMKNFLSKRLSLDDLIQYIDDFCKELTLDKERVQKFVDKKSWYLLIDYILASSCPKNKVTDKDVFDLAEDPS